MNDGLRRFSILIFVFLLAFFAVFVLRRLQGGESLTDLWPWHRDAGQFKPEKFTLPDQPALEIGDVEMLARLNQEYARLSEAVVPSVVSIDTSGIKRERLLDLLGRVWERESPVSGVGSGVIVSKEGHVITNNHVIEDRSDIRITLHNGASYPALLIGADRTLDIAVLRIDGEGDFQPLSFGDSDMVQTGQLAFAIGNPFGLGETITQGIISAKERSISDTQRDLFQTDAAINPGNSGGPLVNLFGEIIGINWAIYSPDSRNRGFLGVGFSIPSNDVLDVFRQILEVGRPVRASLGVQVNDLSQKIRSLGYLGDKGAVVLGVTPDSPAEKAGLQKEDVIVGYDGSEVINGRHLINLIQRTQVGKEVELEVWRMGEFVKLKTTVIDADEALAAVREEPGTRSPSDLEIAQTIGIQVRDPEMVERMRGAQGAIIEAILPGSLAAQKGLAVNDLILGINGVRISSAGQFDRELLASAPAQQTIIDGARGMQTYRVVFPRVPRSSEEEAR